MEASTEVSNESLGSQAVCGRVGEDRMMYEVVRLELKLQ
jgi:hypothetical protein